MRDGMEKRRAAWLSNIKAVVAGAFELDAEYGRLCPSLGGKTRKDRNDALRTITRLATMVSVHIPTMAGLEKGGEFGFKAGLGFDVYKDETLVVCLALLLAARLEPNVSRSIFNVGDLNTYAARRDPAKALEIRSYFREDGVLHSFVVLGRASNLDEQCVRIREAIFNRIMGLPTDKTERFAEAESLVGRGVR